MDKDNIIRHVAATILNVAALDVRNSDSLDFHSLSVASIRKALAAAYDAGAASALQASELSGEGSGTWATFTVAEAAEHLKDWIDDLDDPVRIASLFEAVCGCPRVLVINGTQIRAELL